MIEAQWKVTVQRPAEEVFDFVADLHNEPQFNPDASNIVQKSDGAIGLGTVFEEDFKRLARYVTKIDVYRRPTDLGFDAHNPKADAVVRFGFEAEGQAATSVSCRVQITMKGLTRFAEPLMAPMVRGQIQSTRGPMLKAALER